MEKEGKLKTQKFRNFCKNNLKVTVNNLVCVKQLRTNYTIHEKQLSDIFCNIKHEIHAICDGVADQWRERAAKKQFLGSSLRKLQERTTQEFRWKNIQYKGTFTEILEEIHQIVFE